MKKRGDNWMYIDDEGDKRDVLQPRGWITKEEWDNKINKGGEFIRFQSALATSQTLGNKSNKSREWNTFLRDLNKEKKNVINTSSSVALAGWVFPPAQSSNGAKYWQNRQVCDGPCVTLCTGCLFIVWFDKTCSCELAKVDSLFLWNLHPRLHLTLTQKHGDGSLNELISDSSFQGSLHHRSPLSLHS